MSIGWCEVLDDRAGGDGEASVDAAARISDVKMDHRAGKTGNDPEFMQPGAARLYLEEITFAAFAVGRIVDFFETDLQNITPYGVMWYGSLDGRADGDFAPYSASDNWAASEWASSIPRCREAVRHRFKRGDETPEAAPKSWTH